MKNQLDARLNRIARCVRRGSVAADIGADHGYLICHLVKQGRCPKGYACDVAAGPLERAGKTIAGYGLKGKVIPVFTDGLKGIPVEEVDDIIIAGMGGELIAEILKACPRAWTTDKLFLLQPMTRAEHLRRALYGMGFVIGDEHAVQSGRFVYTVMEVYYTGNPQLVSDVFAWAGKLWGKGDVDSRLYLRQIARRLEQQAAGMEQGAEKNPQADRIREVAAAIGKELAP